MLRTAAVKANSPDTPKANEAAVTGSTVYTYEFDRPGFTYSPIRIEHDVASLHQEACHESPRARVVIDDEDGVVACLNRVSPIR